MHAWRVGSITLLQCIGPVSGGYDDERGDRGEIRHEYLSWLDSQLSRSIVFMSFGIMGVSYSKKLREIANRLERSGVRFLWVVRTPPPDDETHHNNNLPSDDGVVASTELEKRVTELMNSDKG
ncbi:hypothetical protein ACOSP7_027584 [Xanthoceras sorbifolium]